MLNMWQLTHRQLAFHWTPWKGTEDFKIAQFYATLTTPAVRTRSSKSTTLQAQAFVTCWSFLIMAVLAGRTSSFLPIPYSCLHVTVILSSFQLFIFIPNFSIFSGTNYFVLVKKNWDCQKLECPSKNLEYHWNFSIVENVSKLAKSKPFSLFFFLKANNLSVKKGLPSGELQIAKLGNEQLSITQDCGGTQTRNELSANSLKYLFNDAAKTRPV